MADCGGVQQPSPSASSAGLADDTVLRVMDDLEVRLSSPTALQLLQNGKGLLSDSDGAHDALPPHNHKGGATQAPQHQQQLPGGLSYYAPSTSTLAAGRWGVGGGGGDAASAAAAATSTVPASNDPLRDSIAVSVLPGEMPENSNSPHIAQWGGGTTYKQHAASSSSSTATPAASVAAGVPATRQEMRRRHQTVLYRILALLAVLLVVAVAVAIAGYATRH